MTNQYNYEHLPMRELEQRQAVQEDIIAMLDPNHPEAKDRIQVVHDLAKEKQRRSLGNDAVSHTAQQTPGGTAIDTERWRK